MKEISDSREGNSGIVLTGARHDFRTMNSNRKFMKKNFLIAVATILGIQYPSIALPGKTYSQLSSWVKSHTFLASEPDSYGDAEGLIQACRNTVEGKRVCWGAELDKKGLSYQENISLATDTSNTEMENIWARDNANASKILSLIYGKSIADDFKNSSFTLKIDQYVLTNEAYLQWYVKQVGSCCSIDYYIPQKFVNQNVKESEFYNRGEMRFFVGKAFAYQASDKNLFVMSHKQMWKTIDIYQQNKKMYEYFMSKFGPANVNL